MDQGIVQTLKLKYRKRQLQHVLNEMNKHSRKTGPEIIKDVNVLQAIHWIDRAWRETEISTIEKCFTRCGFNNKAPESQDTPFEVFVDELPLALHKMAREVFDCDIQDLINIDAHFDTCNNDMSDWDKPASELMETSHETTTNEDITAEEESVPAQYHQYHRSQFVP